MNKKIKKTVASSTVACLVLTAAPALTAFAADYAGASRIDTAIKIAEASWKGAWTGNQVAVIASGNDANLVDALAVAPLAYAKKAPILLSRESKDAVDAATLSELTTRGVKTVYLAAGTGVLSTKVEEQLTAAGITQIIRLGGANRYETAKNIAAQLPAYTKVAVVNGEIGLADALSVASVAANQGMAIALSDGKTAPAGFDLAGKTVYAVGGSGVISDSLVTSMGAKRLGGSDRLATNANVISEFKSVEKFDTVYVADGRTLVDALTGSVLAAQTSSPIVLADNNMISDAQKTVLTENLTDASAVEAFGGSVGAAQATIKAIPQASQLRVDAVTASAENKLTVTGTLLDKLTQEMITIEDNGVDSIVVSADKKSATVTLSGALTANQDVKVTISGKEFKVNYGFEVKSVGIKSETFDSTTKDKKLTLTANGVATTPDYFLLSGYTVTLTSFNDDGDPVNTLFKTLDENSENGELLDDLSAVENKDFNVQLVVAKNGNIVTSEMATIKIRNLQNSASTIKEYDLKNRTLDAVQNSSTLYVGETADFTKFVVANGSTTSDIKLADGATTVATDVKSSNEGVISVDGDTKEITANAPGTAVVSVYYGDVKKDITLTVTSAKRAIKKIKPAVSNLKVIAGKTADIDLDVTDQFGDPFQITEDDKVTETYPTGAFFESSTGKESGNENVYSNADGDETLTIAGKAGESGSGTVSFKNSDGDVLGSFTMTVTKVDNSTTKKLEIVKVDDYSDDTKLDAADSKDTIVRYKLSNYSSEKVFNENQDLADYVLKFDKKIVKIASGLPAANEDPSVPADVAESETGTEYLSGEAFDIIGIKEGSTTVSIYKPGATPGSTVGTLVGSINITVAKGKTTIKSVTWTAPKTLNYATTMGYSDVLNITKTTLDDIVNGVTLSTTSVHKLRIVDGDNGGEPGDIYIDKNDNGTYEDTDDLVGHLYGKVASGATNLAVGDFDVINGQEVVKDDKGTIVFTITDETDDDKPVVSSASIKCDIK